jgi:hypothetical protein
MVRYFDPDLVTDRREVPVDGRAQMGVGVGIVVGRGVGFVVSIVVVGRDVEMVMGGVCVASSDEVHPLERTAPIRHMMRSNTSFSFMFHKIFFLTKNLSSALSR